MNRGDTLLALLLLTASLSIGARPASAKFPRSLIPDISLILDVAGGYYTREPSERGAHDPTGTGFTLQQLELSMRSSVDHIFELKTNIVFSQFGVEVEEAYARSLGIPGGLQVRLGQFLTRFGRLNPTHPHSWSFADQTMVHARFFGGEGSRGLGGELSWLAPTPWYLELVASMNESGGDCCARSFYGGTTPEIDGVEDLLYTVAIKQFFELDDDWSLSWGLSGQFGPNPTGKDNRSEIYGSDLYLRYRPVDSTDRLAVSLTVEGLFRTRQVPGDVLQDWGVVSMLVANLTPRWEIGGRYGYLSGVADDPLNPEAVAPRHRGTLQVTFYPSHFSRLRLQGTYENPEYGEELWAGVLTAEFLIGAHGAHDF